MIETEKDKIVAFAAITLHNWLREKSENGKLKWMKSLKVVGEQMTSRDHDILCKFHIVEITLLIMLEN